MNSIDSLRYDKNLGAFLGAVVGDALGWPNEQVANRISKLDKKDKYQFQTWIRKTGGQYYSHEEEILEGEYSDDTQLLICTARSMTFEYNWASYFSKVELPMWLLYERGGGGATKRAAQCWANGIVPWANDKKNTMDSVARYFNAGGNGVAMRILPHVMLNLDNEEEMFRQVFLNGIYTHGHPRALLGAMLYAKALKYLFKLNNTLAYGELIKYLIDTKVEWASFPLVKNIEDWHESANLISDNKYMDIWNKTVVEIIKGLEIALKGIELGAIEMTSDTLKKLGCFDPKVNGAGNVSAIISIYIASKFASNPSLGLVEASNLVNADTDTIASMVGALLGAIHGTSFINLNWIKVQDYNYIVNLVNNIGNKKEDNIKTISWEYRLNESIKQKLKTLKVGEHIEVGQFGTMQIKEKKQLKVYSKSNHVESIKLSSDNSQSIYIKLFSKVTNDTYTSVENIKTVNGKALDLLKVIEQFSQIIPPRVTAKKACTLLKSVLCYINDNNIKKVDDPCKADICVIIEKEGIDNEKAKELVKFVFDYLV